MSPQKHQALLRDGIRQSLPKSPYVAPAIIVSLAGFFEVLCIAVGGLLTAWKYPGFGNDIPVNLYLVLAIAAAGLYGFALEVLGLYQFQYLLNPLSALHRIIVAWICVFGIIAAGVFVSKAGESFSRVWLISWFVVGLCFAMSIRFFTAALLRFFNKQGQFNRRAVLVGGNKPIANSVNALKTANDIGLSLVGFFDDREDERSPAEVSGLRKLGNIDELVNFARTTRIDVIIITIPFTAESRLLSILNRLWVLPVDIRISAAEQKLRYRPRAYSYIANLPCLDVFDRPLGDWGPFVKAVEDKLIALLALIALAPFFVAIAAAVKFDSKGPVLFKQKRYGFNNELIEVYKFRSMYTDMTDANAAQLVTKGDPRVTRVGRFIRRTSLDELPQLLNVIKGELSLVGPRPHATKAKAGDRLYEHVVDGYFARHKVKPGMTGWAQINGWRGETDTPEKIQNRVEHDLHYIENWSLTFDLYILAKTPLALLKPEGAY